MFNSLELIFNEVNQFNTSQPEHNVPRTCPHGPILVKKPKLDVLGF